MATFNFIHKASNTNFSTVEETLSESPPEFPNAPRLAPFPSYTLPDFSLRKFHTIAIPHPTTSIASKTETAAPPFAPPFVPPTEIDTNMTTTPLPRSTISDLEAKLYYKGLHSKPLLVARTGMNEWQPPDGPEAFLPRKTIRPAGQHKIQGFWEEEIAPEMHALMEANNVDWTSTDVVRIGYATEAAVPLVIWIGVIPNTLNREHGHTIALECKKVLLKYKIDDVEVEIRESMVSHYAGLPLETPVPTYNPIAELLEPLSSTLGLPICGEKTPKANGTGGFYVFDGDSKTYLITARHVLFNEHDNNQLYDRKFSSQPRRNVLLFSPSRFKTYLEEIEESIVNERVMIDYGERSLQEAGTDEAGRDYAETIMADANKRIDGIQQHYDYVTKYWSEDANRVLGFIRFSPPIVLHEKHFTQDYALIEIAPDKIHPDSFTGNAIDLGTEISPKHLTQMLYQNPRNCHGFKYPPTRIFKIHGVIPKKDLSEPHMLDQNDRPCLIVMKRGVRTGLTVGRANEINSFARKYIANTPLQKTMEWVICPYDDSKFPFFALEGDSGAAIVDCQGRLGGIVTGGHDYRDIVYATPAFSILESLKEHGFKMTIEVPGTA